MATKKKTVSAKNRINLQVEKPSKSPHVKIMNRGQRGYQTDPSNVIQGGITEEYSQGKKHVLIRAGETLTVKREYAELMAKNYPIDILILE